MFFFPLFIFIAAFLFFFKGLREDSYFDKVLAAILLLTACISLFISFIVFSIIDV